MVMAAETLDPRGEGLTEPLQSAASSFFSGLILYALQRHSKHAVAKAGMLLASNTLERVTGFMIGDEDSTVALAGSDLRRRPPADQDKIRELIIKAVLAAL